MIVAFDTSVANCWTRKRTIHTQGTSVTCVCHTNMIFRWWCQQQELQQWLNRMLMANISLFNLLFVTLLHINFGHWQHPQRTRTIIGQSIVHHLPTHAHLAAVSSQTAGCWLGSPFSFPGQTEQKQLFCLLGLPDQMVSRVWGKKFGMMHQMLPLLSMLVQAPVLLSHCSKTFSNKSFEALVWDPERQHH